MLKQTELNKYKDDIEMCRTFGIMYLTGSILEKKYEIGIAMITTATDRGDALAQALLATCYDRGWGISPDDEKALKYYEMASKGGDDSAKYRLGYLYYHGIYVKTDTEKGISLLREVASKGNKAAKKMLDELGSDF